MSVEQICNYTCTRIYTVTNTNFTTLIIIYMQNVQHADWLRACQLILNSAESWNWAQKVEINIVQILLLSPPTQIRSPIGGQRRSELANSPGRTKLTNIPRETTRMWLGRAP